MTHDCNYRLSVNGSFSPTIIIGDPTREDLERNTNDTAGRIQREKEDNKAISKSQARLKFSTQSRNKDVVITFRAEREHARRRRSGIGRCFIVVDPLHLFP